MAKSTIAQFTRCMCRFNRISLRAADVNADYMMRPEPSDTLAALKTLTA